MIIIITNLLLGERNLVFDKSLATCTYYDICVLLFKMTTLSPTVTLMYSNFLIYDVGTFLKTHFL